MNDVFLLTTTKTLAKSLHCTLLITSILAFPLVIVGFEFFVVPNSDHHTHIKYTFQLFVGWGVDFVPSACVRSRLIREKSNARIAG